MENEDLIPVELFCTHYNAETSFISSLSEYGLVEVTIIETKPFINKQHIRELERLVHLHYDLDINIEGIEAINHLLRKVDDLQTELQQLRNRLGFYEQDKST
jgi:phage terminase small subunit